MNSAPVPGPSLRAATLPPCNSTKDFTRVRPSPSPRALLPVAGALPERVGHPRQQLGGGPPAVVPHPQDGLPVSLRPTSRLSPPPPRSAPPCLECSSSLSQTAPPSTSLLPDGSLAPVLSEELSCDGPCWRSPWALSRPAG